MTRRKSLIAMALVGMMTVALYAADTVIPPGKEAPAFTLKDQNGKDVKLADFKGKIVVLEWFNEECPIVKRHYDGNKMNELAAKYAEKGVVWLAINSTNHATVESNAKADKAWKMNRPILDDHSGEIGHAYASTNTPGMFIVDKEGKLAYRGAIDDNNRGSNTEVVNYVAKALDELVAGKAVSTPETKPYGCTVKYKGTK